MEQPQLHWRSILRHYWPFVRQYRWLQASLFLCYGLGALLTTVAVPLIYKGMMDVVSAPDAAAVARLTGLFLWLVATVVMYNLCYRAADYSMTLAQSRALKGLYDHALKGLQEKSYGFYTNAFAGGLVAKVKRFVRAFEVLHDQIVFQIWMSGIGLVSSVVVLWYFSWQLGLLFVAWLAGYGVLVRFMVRWTTPKMLANAEADSDVTAHLSDIITNMFTIKMFGAREREQHAFERTTEAQDVVRIRAWMQANYWNGMFQGVTVGVFEVGIVGAAIVLWGMQVASAGLLLLVVMYVSKSFNIVWSLSKNVINITTALTDANEMVELLDAPVDVADPTVPEPVRITRGRIEFAHVTHGYDNAGHVFKDLSLTIAAGEKVALVGHSGAGKSTLVKLLLRFIDIDGGAVRIDGQSVTVVAQDNLRQHIAYVPQEPILFHRSLYDNIVYGRPGASRAEVEEAARRARAHDFIARLPKGYDTLVGERGVKLSGGERQRVAIARAMLKDVPIVVLDEATSSLDSISERFIQEAFDELMKGRTTIVIAHRLSTIQHMDRIIVLDDGTVAEQGTHAELIAHNGIYAELWHSQVGGFITDLDVQDAA